MKKVLRFVQISALLLGTAAALFYMHIREVFNTPVTVSEPKIIEIPHGSSLPKIAEILRHNGLVRHEFYFIAYAKIHQIFPKIKAGEYLIDRPVSLIETAKLLAEGKLFLRKITFPEGRTIHEYAEILRRNAFLAGDFNMPAEGLFLPETYTFSKGYERQKIVDQATAAMKKIVDQAWADRDPNLPLNSKSELLVLASVIEKETGLSNERAQVSSVFINRLRQDMLLQTDPTVIYALTMGKTELGRPLLRKDLEIDSPYNTYKYAGLPPAPICNPGKEAIMAAAHPDHTPYLYFVASGNGGHNFARTLAEHNQNVAKWRALKK